MPARRLRTPNAMTTVGAAPQFTMTPEGSVGWMHISQIAIPSPKIRRPTRMKAIAPAVFCTVINGRFPSMDRPPTHNRIGLSFRA